MKRTISLLLSLALIFALVSMIGLSVNAEGTDYVDLRPVDYGDQTVVTGGTIEYKDNGTAVLTLTSNVASIKMIYKDASGIFTEAYVNMKTSKYVKYFFETTAASVDIHAHYDRGNKDNADLYLSGMENNAGYYKLSSANYGVWDMGSYLAERSGYLPEDGIIKFSDIEYTVTGNVGDTFTIYYFEVDDEYPDNFGTVIPEEGSSIIDDDDDSDDDVIPGDTTDDDDDPSDTPVTGDAGMVAISVISIIALVGTVTFSKKR